MVMFTFIPSRSLKQFMIHFIYFNSCLQKKISTILRKRNLFMESSFKAKTNINRQTETF